MCRVTQMELNNLRRRAWDRLQSSRNPTVRIYASDLLAVEETAEHYRWLLRGSMAEIVNWSSYIVDGIRANRTNGGVA